MIKRERTSWWARSSVRIWSMSSVRSLTFLWSSDIAEAISSSLAGGRAGVSLGQRSVVVWTETGCGDGRCSVLCEEAAAEDHGEERQMGGVMVGKEGREAGGGVGGRDVAGGRARPPAWSDAGRRGVAPSSLAATTVTIAEHCCCCCSS